MIVYTDYNKPYIIESQNEPMVANHFWGFSGPMMDSTLLPVTYIEQTTVPGVIIDIEGLEILLPTSWNILVTNSDTSELDTVPPDNCAINNYSVIAFSSLDDKLRKFKIKAIGYKEDAVFYHPMIPKGNMLWYPIQQDKNSDIENILCMCVGPYDLYSKYISGKVLGDLLY